MTTEQMDALDDERAGRKPKSPTTLGRRSTEGAWITYYHDNGYVVVGVYADKNDAADAIIDGPGDLPLKRAFIPWGMEIEKVLEG